jgi:hypothetical protein
MKLEQSASKPGFAASSDNLWTGKHGHPGWLAEKRAVKRRASGGPTLISLATKGAQAWSGSSIISTGNRLSGKRQLTALLPSPHVEKVEAHQGLSFMASRASLATS